MTTQPSPLPIRTVIGRIVGVILLAAFLTCITTSAVVVVFDACGWEAPRQTRLWTRLGQVYLLLSCLVVARRAGVLHLDQTGLVPARHWKRGLFGGFIFGLALLAALFAFELALGWVKVYPDVSFERHARRVFTYIFSALAIALLEEWFFHGLLLALFTKWRGPLFALFATNLVFSPLHGIRGDRAFEGLEPSWLTGFELIPHLGAGYQEATEPLLMTFGILLFGIALTLIRNWTKTIYLSIGLHAAWVYGKRLDGHFTYWTSDHPVLWTGGEHYLEGLPSWGLILLTTFVIYRFVKDRDPGPEAPA